MKKGRDLRLKAIFATKDVKESNAASFVKSAPLLVRFVPSKKVLQKLIKRATQIKDVLTELNPYNIVLPDIDKLRMLRVLPHAALYDYYPDM